MGYVTYDYYTDTFHGHPISMDAFPRLESDAGMMMDSVVQRAVSEDDLAGDVFKRAVCYQIETLALAGGIATQTETIIRGRITSVSNDGYSESREATKEGNTLFGLPLSPMAMATLRKLGYLNRWTYAGRESKP